MRVTKFNTSLLSKLIGEQYQSNAAFATVLSARGVEKTQDSIKKWRQGVAMPRAADLPEVAEELGIYVGDLFEGHEKNTILQKELNKNPNVDNYVLIDKINKEDSIHKAVIDKGFIDGNLDPANLRLVPVTGDSMFPEFCDGDYIIVDMVNGREDFIKASGIYLVQVGNITYIKNVEFLPDDKVRLKSINKRYDDILPHVDGYNYEILGKVCNKIQRLKGLSFSEQKSKHDVNIKRTVVNY